MTPQEILLLVQNTAAIKRSYQDKAKNSPDTPLPEYYPLYPVMVDYHDRIRIHSEVNYYPERLFKFRSPNETEPEHKYRKDNYKNITLPVFMDYISTITRGWSDNNWNIEYQEDENVFVAADSSLQKYIEQEIKYYGSIENFMKFVLPQIKTTDANGCIAVRPHDIPFLRDENGQVIVDGEGKPSIDETALYEPTPYYYASWQKVSFEPDEFYLFELTEKSKVEFGNAEKLMGMVYEFYDEQNIWKIKQVGKYTEWKFEAILIYNHAWGRVPVTELKGVPKIVDNKIIWQSPFLFSCDLLDLVTLNNSNLQLSINTTVFPYRVMYGDICEFEDDAGNRCQEGYLFPEGVRKICSHCNGSGLKSRVSPLGVLLLRPPSRESEGDSKFTNKPMEYISPDVSSLKFLEEKIARDTEKARQILHLHTSNTEVKGSENMTATGMALDMQALYSFVKTVSDQSFQLFEFIIDAIGWMRYGDSYKKPVIIYPNTFDFKTEADYLAEISNAQKAGLPPFIIYTILYRYIQSVYYNEKVSADVFNLIVKTDRLVMFNNDDLALMVARGTAAKWEGILHDSAITFVGELNRENPKFLEQDFAKQQEQLIKKAKDKAAEIVPASANAANAIINATAPASE